MTVLILGDEQDAHAAHILSSLAERGQTAHLLDSCWFPGQLTLTRGAPAGSDRLRLPTGQVLDIAEVRSIYWRNYNSVGTPELPSEEQSFIAYHDARSLLESFLQNPVPLWVNGWEGYQLHQWKPEALLRARKAGAKTPRTLWTNDPLEVQAFLESCPRAIFKPVQGGAHTRRLDRSWLDGDRLSRLSIAPVTLQEEIEGTNIRVFVAGERVLACEIRTAEIDFREDQQPVLLPHALPREMEEQSRRIATALSLVWTGIDFRLTDQGEYLFLEANPSPMFLGFESATELPLTEALCDLLCAGRSHGPASEIG